MFIILILELIGSCIYLFKTRKGIIQEPSFIRARNIFIYVSASYFLYLVVMLIIILVDIGNVDENDRGVYVGVFVGYGVVFLVPRVVVGWGFGRR